MYTYQEAVDYLLRIPRFSKKTSPENLMNLLQRLGNPQQNFKVIHVAGTNGKGSVCAFIHSILMHTGYKVGLFTSPHLVRMNERIRVNEAEIDDAEFLSCFLQMKEQIDRMVRERQSHPSFFECVFVMAMLYFHKQHIDYAVLETGLGGRLDATNIISKPEVCVITKIALDHTAILGNTLEQIAYEKGGIIKSGVPLIYEGNNQTVSEVLKGIACQLGNSDLLLTEVKSSSYKILKKPNKDIDFCCCNGYYDKSVFQVPFPAEYQCMNARLAIAAIERIVPGLAAKQVYEGIARTVWAGRMEQVQAGVYFDGGHNLDGVTALMDTVSRMTEDKYLLFSAVQDKNYSEMIRVLCQREQWKGIILTAVPNDRRTNPEELKRCFQAYTQAPIYIEADCRKAYELALQMKKSGELLLCTGSLYLIGALRNGGKND